MLAFNEAINGRDIDRLAELMTETHRFVDAEGGTVSGRNACLAAWRDFFEAFPDYQNVFTRTEDGGDGKVVADGYSVCSVAELDGPAVWRAVVRGQLVDSWQVSEAQTPDQ